MSFKGTTGSAKSKERAEKGKSRERGKAKKKAKIKHVDRGIRKELGIKKKFPKNLSKHYLIKYGSLKEYIQGVPDYRKFT